MIPQTVPVPKVTATVEDEPRALTTAHSVDNEMMIVVVRRKEMVKEKGVMVI